MMPLSTSFSALSISLAINGAAPIVSGTIAAVVPILVPTIRRVSGKSTMIRMINGKLLSVFTVISSAINSGLFGFRPSCAERTSKIAGTRPMRNAKSVETTLI